MDPLHLIIALLIVGFIVWLIGRIDIVSPLFRQIAQGLIVIAVIIYLIKLFWSQIAMFFH